MKLPRRIPACTATLLMLRAGIALAQPAPPSAPSAPPPPSPPAAADTSAKAEEARDHFQKGLALSDDGAWEAAIVEFMLSRQLHPTRSATKNAAVALRTLKRFDEAVDMFEELLKFPNLPPADRDLAERELRSLGGLVGSIDLQGGEAGAAIVIDGRARGVAPASAPIRISAGTHVVRVYKEGFMPFEARVDVAGGQIVPVQAHLAALAQSGRLRVTEAAGKRLEVLIDSVTVGVTPWEGTLPPGDHTVALRGEGDLGTQPAAAPVKLGQLTPLTLVAEPLAGRVRLQPTPAGASIAIDGVSVGRGLWEGRLRAGAHRFEVALEGFLPQVREVSVRKGEVLALAIPLERDPGSPLWGENRGRFFVEVDGAFAITPSLGGDVAGTCSGSCSATPGLGFLGVGRAGYRFVSGFLLSVDAGYMTLIQKISDRSATIKPFGLGDVTGKADDTLRLGGFLLGASAGVRLGSRFPILLRLGTGVLIGTVHDHRTASFKTVHTPATPYTVDASELPSALSLYLAPEARFGMRIGKGFELSLGVEGRILVGLSTPAWVPADQKVSAKTDGVATFPADTLSGKVVGVIVPGLGARYEF